MKNKYEYHKDGLTIKKILNEKEYEYILKKTSEKILTDFDLNQNQDLNHFHEWNYISEESRNFALSAFNRHFKRDFWREINLEEKCKNVLEEITNLNLKIWDEGLGTSAYRLIRPLFNDGYPPSRKSWGPGGELISITIPLLGFTKFESQGFILGSHLKDFESFLDYNEKFCSGERRLKNPKDYKFTRLTPSKGECIIFHWDMIHTEQIIGQNQTKLALELRYEQY